MTPHEPLHFIPLTDESTRPAGTPIAVTPVIKLPNKLSVFLTKEHTFKLKRPRYYVNMTVDYRRIEDGVLQPDERLDSYRESFLKYFPATGRLEDTLTGKMDAIWAYDEQSRSQRPYAPSHEHIVGFNTLKNHNDAEQNDAAAIDMFEKTHKKVLEELKWHDDLSPKIMVNAGDVKESKPPKQPTVEQ